MQENKENAEKVLTKIRKRDFSRDYDCTPFECGVFSLLDEAASVIEISLIENQRLIDLGRNYKARAEKAEKCIAGIEEALKFQRYSAAMLRIYEWRGKKEE